MLQIMWAAKTLPALTLVARLEAYMSSRTRRPLLAIVATAAMAAFVFAWYQNNQRETRMEQHVQDVENSTAYQQSGNTLNDRYGRSDADNNTARVRR